MINTICRFVRQQTNSSQHRKLGNTSGVSDARKYYQKLAEQRKCPKLTADWFTNSKRLIINLGYGTTGTRWVSCVMSSLNFSSAHWNPDHNLMTGTKAWNNYEFISDNPVPEQAWQLIKANPNGTFLLSMRDAQDWVKSRLHHHSWITKQETPCGTHFLKSKEGKKSSPAATVAYEAWVACLVPQDQLFSFNLWKMDKIEFVLELVQFLKRRGHRHGWLNLTSAENLAEENITTHLPALLEKCGRDAKHQSPDGANGKPESKREKPSKRPGLAALSPNTPAAPAALSAPPEVRRRRIHFKTR